MTEVLIQGSDSIVNLKIEWGKIETEFIYEMKEIVFIIIVILLTFWISLP